MRIGSVDLSGVIARTNANVTPAARAASTQNAASDTRGAQAPISTTHTVTSAVGGAGAAGGLRHIRWRVARRIGLAWLFTFPGAALLAVLAHLVLRLLPV